MPIVSVIIPAFNAQATLESTLQSAQDQSVRDCEFLIIDDGSRDGTLQLAQKLEAADDRIRVISQSNAGVAAARNAGLDVARGSYIHFLDADDLLCPGAFENLIAAEKNFGSGAAAGAFDVFSPQDGSLLQHEPPGELLGIDDIIARNHLHTLTHIIRRDMFGGLRFNTSYPCYEDQDLWFRLAERGVRWAVTRRRVARYRIVPGSLSKSAQVLPCAEDVYIRATLRTGAMTPEQLHARLGDFTLGYSTRMAVLSESVEAGARLFAGARVHPVITPQRAAAMGHSQGIFALGRWPRPENPTPGGATLGNKLSAWWSVCVENRWMRSEDLPTARREFARLCIPPQRVAHAIRSCCNKDITLVGFGRNAHWFLQQDLSTRRIFVRDDRFGSSTDFDLPVNVICEPMNAPVPPGRSVVITPVDDETLAPRFPGAFRWKLIRNQLADQALAA